MEFQELKVFMAIVETGGFKRASSKLNLSQSAISQSLANLERKLDEKLLERTSPIRPTIVGHELLGHAQFILSRESEFMNDLQRLKQGYLQKLAIAVDYLVNEHFCHEILKLLVQELPEISIKLKRLPAREMIKAVQDNKIEIGFGPFQKNMGKLKKVKLFEEPSFLVTSKSNKSLSLYKKNPMSFIKQSTLMASYLDEVTIRPSKMKLRSLFKKTWEIDNLDQQIKLVNLGLGVTFLPRTILTHNSVAKKFIVLDKLPFKEITKPYGIYYNSTSQLSEVANSFIRIANNSWGK